MAMINALALTALAAFAALTPDALVADAAPPNLVRNPGAEEGLWTQPDGREAPAHWTVGGWPEPLPHLNPGTHAPDPPARSGENRFGISIGWQAANLHQFQTLAVEPGRAYRAGFWATHADGTDERIQLAWCEGLYGNTETVIVQTRPLPEPEWTHYTGVFTPATDRITLILRYRHRAPTGIASCHVDDVYVYAEPLPQTAPELPPGWSPPVTRAPRTLHDDTGPGGLRSYRVQVETGDAIYTIDAGGVMDEFNTFRHNAPSLYQPNRRLEIANLGDDAVTDIRLTIHDRRQWGSEEDLIAEVFHGSGTVEAKTFALWDWCRQNLRTGPGGGGVLWGEHKSLILFLNSLGVGACGTFHTAMPRLAALGGLEAQLGFQANGSHATQRAIFDGSDRYLDCMIRHGDGDQPQGYFCLNLDNSTLAGTAQIAADHYLSERAGSDPSFYWATSLFGGPGETYWASETWTDPVTVGLSLRPGESFTWSWDLPESIAAREGRQEGTNAVATLRYDVPLDAASVARFARNATGLRLLNTPEGSAVTAEANALGQLVYGLELPYVLIGGRVEVAFAGPVPGESGGASAALAFSLDGEHWTDLTGACTVTADGLTCTLPEGPEFAAESLTRRLHFRVELDGRDSPAPVLQRLVLMADALTYVPSLPALSAGLNRIHYSDTARERTIRVTHEWVPSEEVIPPPPSARALEPANGAAAGFATDFRWEQPEADARWPITGYEFQLSPDPEFRRPLMPPLHAILEDATPEFRPTVKDAYLPGRACYWRVRPRNSAGLWGEWTSWSFVPHGPGAPVNVRIGTHGRRLQLQWDAPVAGNPPRHYEIHGSPHPGFTPSASPLPRQVGGWSYTFPATRMAVVEAGDEVGAGSAGWAITESTEVFYRVIAVDADANRSVPSPVVAAPHPSLVPAALPPGRAGEDGQWRIPCRLHGGRFAFTLQDGVVRFDADAPEMDLIEAPDWMALDGAERRLYGRPDRPGEYPVLVRLRAGDRSEERAYTVRVDAR